MTPEERRKLITEVHASGLMAVIVVTGGGTGALADLCSVPGASRTLLEGRIPYSARSVSEFLEHSPVQAVSGETAAQLARRAFERARHLLPDESVPVVGVSCTAALVTDRPKKGEHRLHVAVSCAKGPRVFSLKLKKGARTREQEERVAADLVLQAIAHEAEVRTSLDLGLLPQEEVRITGRSRSG